MVPRMARIEPGSVSRGGPSVEGFSGVRIRPGWTSRRGEEAPGQSQTRGVGASEARWRRSVRAAGSDQVPGGITAWHYRALVRVFTPLPETRAPHAGSRHPTGRPDKRPTAPPTIGSRKAYTEPVSDGRWCSAIGTSPVGSA